MPARADIVALVDGRTELVDDVAAAPDDARRYLAAEARQLLDTPRILDGLTGAMRPDRANQERVDAVVLPALRRIANQG